MPATLAEMCSEFCEWQQGPQGGGNKKITAVQNVQMIKRVCSAINATNLSCLLQDTVLWRFFYAKKTSHEWTGQTSRSYLVAIKKFMMFVVKDILEEISIAMRKRERSLNRFLVILFFEVRPMFIMDAKKKSESELWREFICTQPYEEICVPDRLPPI